MIKVLICQSCGMPLSDKFFSTNKNNTPNKEYCKFCFIEGKFKDDGIYLAEKIKMNIEIAVRNGMSQDKALNLAENVLSGLKRWKINKGN